MLPKCHRCSRQLHEGEAAYAEDWKVMDTTGTTVALRWETRYVCEDCEAAS